MIDTKELVPIKAQISKIENQAQSITIQTVDDQKSAIDLVSKLKDIGSDIKAKKESVTKPLNEALKNIREIFSPLETQFANAEAIIKTKLLDYKRRKDAEVRVEEAKIAKKVESGYMRLDTAEKKLEQVERVENKTRGNIGEVQVHKVPKVRIVDENLVPRQYLELNMVAIRRDALGGKTIPGVEVYYEEVIAAR